MANTTLNIEVDILNEPVALELEVQWSFNETGELIIDDFYGYHFDYKSGAYTRIPYWLHKIIETTQLLEEEYLQAIEEGVDDSY